MILQFWVFFFLTAHEENCKMNIGLRLKIGPLFWMLAANRQHAREGALNGKYSRCTDWKFYTWFHLNGTNGPVIAPFHHFPSQGDVKGGCLREAR